MTKDVGEKLYQCFFWMLGLKGRSYVWVEEAKCFHVEALGLKGSYSTGQSGRVQVVEGAGLKQGTLDALGCEERRFRLETWVDGKSALSRRPKLCGGKLLRALQ